jgi:hypothetical protein
MGRMDLFQTGQHARFGELKDRGVRSACPRVPQMPDGGSACERRIVRDPAGRRAQDRWKELRLRMRR